MPDKFKDPNFDITTDTGKLTQQSINSKPYNIRVYNKYFVDEHLSFLRDHDNGEIRPFAIIGSENIKYEEQIQEKQSTLGDAASGIGLRAEYAEKFRNSTEKKGNGRKRKMI